MSTHDEYMTRRQARDLARRLARLERKTRSTAAAHADLRHSALDHGARIPIKDEQGNTTAYVGSGPTGIEHVDGPVPEQPSVPFVDVGGEVVKIQHSGLDVNEAPAPGDFRRAQIHVSQDQVFEPSLSTLAGYLEEADGSFTHRLPGGEWYVGIVWETLSGKQSVMSGTVLADIPPLVDTSDLEDTLAAAEEKLNTYRDEVAAPRFEALETGLETNTTNLVDARSRLSAAEQTLSPLPGRIESAERDVEAAKEAAESAEARAVEASNNASNRLTNGGFELGLDHWDTTNVTLSNDAHTGTQAALIGAGGSLVPDASIPVSEGDVWDVSAFGKGGTALVVDVLNAADSSVLESFSTPMGSTWSETGRQRVEIPIGVDYMNIRITGDNTLVDDVVLRDVTDVVRLERAATAARQTADQALAELELMRLAVDGEGGLKDRLDTAETVLETKADESALDQLDQKLAGNLAAFEAHYTRVWRQPTPPPPGTHYAWLGEPHASVSVRLDGDGNETARNYWIGARNTPPFILLPNAGFARSPMERDYEDGVFYVSGYHEDNPDEFYISAYTNQEWGHSSLSLDDSFYPLPDVFTQSVEVMSHYPVNAGMTRDSQIRLVPGEWTTLTNTDSGQSRPMSIYSMDNEGIPVNARIYMRHWKLEKGITDGSYFDGDTASDRARDLWYNQDGVPHEWVNGQGWEPISDARITELANTVSAHATRLQTAETGLEEALEGPIDHDRLRVGTGAFDEAFASKLIADHATIINAAMRNLSVSEKLLFAEAIGEQIWAELGVFNRLQAREGWIGGTNLADGAVTAEKIHATRELITKIMGAEWAYISEKLVVEGELIANHADVISAAIKNLSVTERADLFEAFITTLGAQEAVIDLLIGTEAWIGGTMLKDDTVTTRHIEFTETLVGNIAELLHLVVDRIDVNSLWADQTWQAAGHFGAETANLRNRTDGRGMEVTAPNLDDPNGPRQTLMQVGVFGDNTWATIDPTTGETLSSIGSDGAASFQMVDSTTDPTIAGRRLVGGLSEHAASHHASGILDAIGWGEVGQYERNGTNTSAGPYEAGEIGLLQVNFTALPGRQYEIRADAGHIVRNGTTILLRLRYTDNDLQPDIGSDLLTQVGMGGSGGWENMQTTARFQGDPDTINGEPKPVRVLMSIQSNNAWSFVTGSHFRDLELQAMDVGPIRAPQGEYRSTRAASGGAIGGKKQWTSIWQPNAFTNWRNGREAIRTGGTADLYLMQGYDPLNTTYGIQGSQMWFGNNQATSGEVGSTLPAAMAGAELDSGTLDVYAAYAPGTESRIVRAYWHEEPNHNGPLSPVESRLIGEFHVPRGGRGSIQLPPACLDAIKNGSFKGFLFYKADTARRYAVGLSWERKPNLTLNYQR